MTTVLADPQVFKPAGAASGLVQFAEPRISTTDATTTQIAALSVAEGEAIIISAMVSGRQSDLSDQIVAHIECGARRAAAGNVTLTGTPTVRILESDANTNVTVTADTTNQTVDINVVGVAAQTWSWEIFGSYFKV